MAQVTDRKIAGMRRPRDPAREIDRRVSAANSMGVPKHILAKDVAAALAQRMSVEEFGRLTDVYSLLYFARRAPMDPGDLAFMEETASWLIERIRARSRTRKWSDTDVD